MKECLACGEPVGPKGAKGFCSKHYHRWRAYGDPLASGRLSIVGQHATNTIKSGPDDCWEWTGRCDKDGYGVLGNNVRAHRVAYQLATGIDPVGLSVCHTCDNPPCQNPAHLFAGTNAENIADKMAKGRWRGNNTGNLGNLRRRLTAEQVAEIRTADISRYGAMAELARRYGVSHEHIRRILNGSRR